MWQSFTTFIPDRAYGIWIGVTAIFLIGTVPVHNAIAWLKIKPFLNKRASRIFVGTAVLASPYWIIELWGTWASFNNLAGSQVFTRTRPMEPLFRDWWWVFASVKLLMVTKSHYDLSVSKVVSISPRFGVLLFAIFLSLVFVILDLLTTVEVLSVSLPLGVNPFWKIALVLKAFTDTIILDDFKVALDQLWSHRRQGLESRYLCHRCANWTSATRVSQLAPADLHEAVGGKAKSSDSADQVENPQNVHLEHSRATEVT